MGDSGTPENNEPDRLGHMAISLGSRPSLADLALTSGIPRALAAPISMPKTNKQGYSYPCPNRPSTVCQERRSKQVSPIWSVH